MSFAFVPRKLGQSSTAACKTKAAPLISASPSQKHTHSPDKPILKEPNPSDLRDEKKWARLAELALSEYAISHDHQLLQYLNESDDGFIPLAWLIHCSGLFTHSSSTPSPSLIAKSIRTHASNTLEVRMALAAPAKRAWKSLQVPDEEAGGYEVRRLDLGECIDRARHAAQDYWTERTVYVERIPHAHWSTAGIASLIDTLLGSVSVQNVLLPSHHLDAPGTPPRCKGFAFVVLSTLSDTDTLLRHWPRDITEKNQCEGDDSSVREARTAGFRCLSKRDWDRLEVEYLAHREHLLLQMEENQDDMSPAAMKQAEDGHMDATFPQNRLLLVRGVHVRTNRTALKSLLSRAVGTLDAIEYVDYTKGMDSCYVRVSALPHSITLESYFKAHTLCQMEANDSVGGSIQPGSQPLRVERVLGRAEEVYWSKIPEHVRRAAMDSEISAQPTHAAAYESIRTASVLADAPFPPGCLLFVRNVHPQTNRTTVRALLSQALVRKGMSADNVDYVDYTKGMDTCYIRVAEPNAALALDTWFSETALVQVHAGDDQGSPSVPDMKAITLERVLGRKEELYWEKVPEKVRRAAVDRARGGSVDMGMKETRVRSRKRKNP